MKNAHFKIGRTKRWRPPLIAQICARRELWDHALLGEQNGSGAWPQGRVDHAAQCRACQWDGATA